MAVVSGECKTIFRFAVQQIHGTSCNVRKQVQATGFDTCQLFCSSPKPDALIELVESVISIAEKTEKSHTGGAVFICAVQFWMMVVPEIRLTACDSQISAYVGSRLHECGLQF